LFDLTMKRESQSELLRIACWVVFVILPTTLICWLAGIHTAAIAVAIPFILVAERVYRRLLQRFGLWGVVPDSDSSAKTKIEPGASPDGGPAKPLGNSGVSSEPPAVS
jgi:hypothetical protein